MAGAMSNFKSEIRILVGEHAGKVVIAHAARLQRICDKPYGTNPTAPVDGMIVPSLNNAEFLAGERNAYFNNPIPKEYEDLFTAFDQFGVRIEVGQTVIYATKPYQGATPNVGTVVEITKPNYNRQGYMSRKLKIRSVIGQHIDIINNPRTIIVGHVVRATE